MVWDCEVDEVCEEGVEQKQTEKTRIMDVQLINKELLVALHKKAAQNERLRMNFDLRTHLRTLLSAC